MTAAAVLFLFGAATAVLSLQLPLGSLRMPGSGFFPFALGLILMGLSATQAVKVHLEPPRPPVAEPGATRRVALFMGVVALSVALLQPLGYVAASFLLMLGLLRVLGVGWSRSALVAALSAAGCWLLFVRWLKIPLPPGPLGL